MGGADWEKGGNREIENGGDGRNDKWCGVIGGKKSLKERWGWKDSGGAINWKEDENDER